MIYYIITSSGFDALPRQWWRCFQQERIRREGRPRLSFATMRHPMLQFLKILLDSSEVRLKRSFVSYLCSFMFSILYVYLTFIFYKRHHQAKYLLFDWRSTRLPTKASPSCPSTKTRSPWQECKYIHIMIFLSRPPLQRCNYLHHRCSISRNLWGIHPLHKLHSTILLRST